MGVRGVGDEGNCQKILQQFCRWLVLRYAKTTESVLKKQDQNRERLGDIVELVLG